MDLRNVFPLIPPMVWDSLEDLASKDWITVEPGATLDDTMFVVNTDGLKPKTRWFVEAANAGEFTAVGSPIKGCFWLYAVSRLVANGVRCFSPTDEQCESFERVDVNVPLADYRQPFPTMLIRFPGAYRKTIDARTGGVPESPRYVLVHHWHPHALFVGAQIVDRNGLPAELVYSFGGTASNESLEKALGVYYNSDQTESALLEQLTRVSLNLAMFLTHVGSRTVPSDDRTLEKARRNLKRGVKPDLQRRTIAEHVHFILPHHDIVVRETIRRDGTGAGTHASPKAHWRRGHWRAAPGKGEARSRGEQVPLVFVRPAFVMGDSGEKAPDTVYSVR